MKYTFASLAIAVGASAASFPRTTSCTFTLTASGGVSGIVGQLDDGQNRVGGGHPTGSFSINNGQITDSQGRGCILTPPSSQFQCDVGATPTGGFALGDNGVVTSNGSPTFFACPATDTEFNIYTVPVPNQLKCVEIQLTASGCFAQPSPSATQTVTATVQPSCPAPVTVTKTEQSACPPPQTVTVTSVVTTPAQQSQTPAPTPSTTVAPPPAPSSSCPADLPSAFQFPHLIIPVSSTSPDTAAGTQFNGQVSSTVSSIFNFDIPTSYTGTCTLIFLFPEQSQLQTSSFTFSGDGQIDFKKLSTVATQSTTFNNQGSVETDFGVKTITPGTATTITSFPCPGGTAVSYELSSQSGTSLTYFQDFNPCPIGLYITIS